MSTRSLLRWPAIAVLTIAVTACSDGPFSPYWDRGTYDLAYANNRTVPSTVYSSAATGRVSRVDVIGGSLTLRRDDSYQLVVRVRETSGIQDADVTHAYAGHFDHEGRMLYLSYFDAGSWTYGEIAATWRDDSIELVLPDVAAGRGVLMRFVR
jgi:hypothetical protein